MTDTNAAAAELWGWVYQPFQNLRERCAAEQDGALAPHIAEFLDQLGLRETSDHPLIATFAERLENFSDDAERMRFLAGDESEGFVFELVQEQVGQQEQPGTDGYDEEAWHAFLAENGPSWDGAEALAVADEVVRENPEFAEISEERRRELLAEVLGRGPAGLRGRRREAAAVEGVTDEPMRALAQELGLQVMDGKQLGLAKEEVNGSGWLGAIRVGHNISQAHYFVFGNKRFGTAAVLLCLAAAGTYPDDEKITLLGNLLNDVLDGDVTAEEADRLADT